MKNYTLFLLVLLLSGIQELTAQTNNIFVNFDDLDMSFLTFSGAQFSKVSNPSKTGINTSENAGQVISSSNSTYEGIYNSVAYSPMNLSVMKTYKMKVLSPRIGNIAFKLEFTPNKAVDYISVTVPTTKVGEWEEIYFDLPAAKTNLYDHIVISFDMGDNTHNGEKWYFDDITLTTRPAISALTLPNVFSSNMVLQQNSQTAFWGWAGANENVEINAGWGPVTTVTADAKGKWITKIQTPKAVPGQATPYNLTFKTTTKSITLTNILIGDVWLCSGQSNMEYTMTPNLPWTRGVKNFTTEIAAANYPNIRLYKIPRNAQAQVAENCGGTWLECNPTNVAAFSGVAYYFGRELNQNSEINIPIGLLLTAYGGSSCQAWMSREVLATDAEFKTKILDPYDAAPTTPNPENRPTNLYNGMVAPLIPFGIKGALWYQGESNASNGAFYTKLCSAMFQDWRTKWGLGDFPLYFVQLPAYTDPNWPAFRDAQTNMLLTPNTGMAVTIDIIDSDPINIHPENKLEVGQRLAKWAMAKDYRQNVVFSGPIYKSNIVQGNKIIISFHSATIGTGLLSKDNTVLKEFEICGSNNIFYQADAIIVGNTVEVSSPNVTVPTVVKYAYSASPITNFTNKEGLPATPFKTSTWNNAIVVNNSIISGVEHTNLTSKQICKNPANNVLNVHFSMTTQLQIFNLQGKLIRSVKVNPVAEMDISALENALYLVKAINDEGIFTAKFIKN
jgi:sialate O-acetylesterase